MAGSQWYIPRDKELQGNYCSLSPVCHRGLVEQIRPGMTAVSASRTPPTCHFQTRTLEKRGPSSGRSEVHDDIFEGLLALIIDLMTLQRLFNHLQCFSRAGALYLCASNKMTVQVCSLADIPNDLGKTCYVITGEGEKIVKLQWGNLPKCQDIGQSTCRKY